MNVQVKMRLSTSQHPPFPVSLMGKLVEKTELEENKD